MQQKGKNYSVVGEVKLPGFAGERRFVATEKEHAEKELARLKGGKGVKALVRRLAGTSEDDWRHYIRALDRYLAKVDEHDDEVAAGLVPVKFFVVNNGDGDDAEVKVRVTVENGTVHPAKRPPERPERVDDGPKHVPEWQPEPAEVETVVSGFVRSGVKIGKHEIEAEFSQLEAGDSADLVHEILYIASDDETRLRYEISSKRMDGVERGDVEF